MTPVSMHMHITQTSLPFAGRCGVGEVLRDVLSSDEGVSYLLRQCPVSAVVPNTFSRPLSAPYPFWISAIRRDEQRDLQFATLHGSLL